MSQYGQNISIAGSRPPIADDVNIQHKLGDKIYGSGGRAYRYVLAGAVDLVTGNLLQSPVEDTGDTDITPAATAIGATSITTTSNETVTADQYAGGYIHITVTPGLGQMFRISGHPAATAGTVTFELEDPIQVALTTTSRFDLILNPYAGVLQNPAAASGNVVGVAVNDITAARHGWVQVEGPASILDDGGIAVGQKVVASNATAGAVEDVASSTQAIVGVAITASSTGEQAAINLVIG